MTRRAALSVLLISLLSANAVPALADGDPASDVLLGQDVFLPYSPVSQTLQRELYAVTAATRSSGYPVKVALISAPSDLGVVPALFGKPSAYARFLSAELPTAGSEPVLVVMPNGFGLASRGKQLPDGALRGIAAARGTNGLAAAATVAVRRLAAAAGHPVPASATTAGDGASSATVRHALSAIAVLVIVACAAIAGAFVLRSRRRRDLAT